MGDTASNIKLSGGSGRTTGSVSACRRSPGRASSETLAGQRRKHIRSVVFRVWPRAVREPLEERFVLSLDRSTRITGIHGALDSGGQAERRRLVCRTWFTRNLPCRLQAEGVRRRTAAPAFGHLIERGSTSSLSARRIVSTSCLRAISSSIVSRWKRSRSRRAMAEPRLPRSRCCAAVSSSQSS